MILLKTTFFTIFSYLLSNKQYKFWYKIKNFIYKFKYFDAHFKKENAILIFWFHIKIRFSIKLHRINLNSIYTPWNQSIMLHSLMSREKGQSVRYCRSRQETKIDIRLIHLQYASHSSCRILYIQLRGRRKKREHSGLSFTVSLDPYHLVFHLHSANCFFTIASRSGFFIPAVFSILFLVDEM